MYICESNYVRTVIGIEGQKYNVVDKVKNPVVPNGTVIPMS